MKKIIIGVLTVAITLTASVYYFLGTPTYSLYKTKKAITEHDSITFNKYVDVDRVISDLLEQGTDSLENNPELKDNPFSGMAQSFMDSIKEQMKNLINKSVEEITQGKDIKISSIKIDTVTKAGKSAKIILKNIDGDTINIDMIQTPQRYWRIIGMKLEDFKKISPLDFSENSSSDDKSEKISASVKFGEKTSIGSGWFITINKPEIYITPKGSFDSPSENNQYVAVEVEYSNETSNEGSIDPDNLKLKDTENHSYDTATFGAKKPKLRYDTIIPANDKVNGYITFEVPENAEISKAIYSNDNATAIFE